MLDTVVEMMSDKTRLRRSAVFMVLLWSSLVSATAGGESYRVTGIIEGPHRQIVLIEKSDETQHLFKLGDAIDQYEIVRIETHGVYLSRGAGEIYLELEGEPRRLDDLVASSRVRELKISDGNATQDIDFERARVELARLSQPGVGSEHGAGRSGGRSNGTAGSGPESSDSSSGSSREKSSGSREESAGQDRAAATLAQQLNAALGLPSYTVITAVGTTPVNSVQHAILLLAEPINNGWAVRLTVGGSIPGVDAIYVTSATAPLPPAQP